MSPTIEVLERLSDSLVSARYVDRQRMIWGARPSRWKLVKLRQPAGRCPITGRRLGAGELAWRPLGDPQWRDVRISAEVLRRRP